MRPSSSSLVNVKKYSTGGQVLFFHFLNEVKVGLLLCKVLFPRLFFPLFWPPTLLMIHLFSSDSYHFPNIESRLLLKNFREPRFQRLLTCSALLKLHKQSYSGNRQSLHEEKATRQWLFGNVSIVFAWPFAALRFEELRSILSRRLDQIWILIWKLCKIILELEYRDWGSLAYWSMLESMNSWVIVLLIN